MKYRLVWRNRNKSLINNFGLYKFNTESEAQTHADFLKTIFPFNSYWVQPI